MLNNPYFSLVPIFSTLSLIYIINKSVFATAPLRLRSELNAFCFDCVNSTHMKCVLLPGCVGGPYVNVQFFMFL